MTNSKIDQQANTWAATHGLLVWLRTTRLWRTLKKVTFLRSTLYLALQLRRAWREDEECAQKSVDLYFCMRNDPWNYALSALEQERFAKQSALLDSISDGSLFCDGLEIGCAEGLYTEALAERCESLLVLDISPTALMRARRRRMWSEKVRFLEFDLRCDVIPGSFDLIVIAGVLEYFLRRSTFRSVREKLVAALRPGGYLLVETTKAIIPISDTTWWAKSMIIGKWINHFIAEHPSLATISSVETDDYVITVCRKALTK